MKIAVVTGEHGFQEKQFDAVFESMEDVQFVREDLDVFVDAVSYTHLTLPTKA